MHEDYAGPPTFQRMFICYEASRKGFKQACRPFIGLDGCHLKGPYGGILLCAIALDGNQRLFPVAFAVVEVECRESWDFLDSLFESFGDGIEDHPLVRMLDQTKGLMEVVAEKFPWSRHRNCRAYLCQLEEKQSRSRT